MSDMSFKQAKELVERMEFSEIALRKAIKNLDKSSKTDDLKDTVDYVTLNSIVVDEMGIPCKLLETVAQRIIARFLNECAEVDWASVSVSKLNPPIGGDVEKVTVMLEEKRAY